MLGLNITFSHRGARNSLTDIPISAYDTIDVQKPHCNHPGKESGKLRHING